MFKENQENAHRRYYQIGGVTIQVVADLPMTEATFQPKFKAFEVDGPGEDTITISHHFSMPDLKDWDLGDEVYRKVPWTVCRTDSSCIYMGISEQRFVASRDLGFRIWCRLRSLWGKSCTQKEWLTSGAASLSGEGKVHLLAVATHDHTTVSIYHKSQKLFSRGNLHSLTLFPTDQIILGRVLADREAFYIHASGLVLDGNGLLFVGHADAGKTTIVNMLKDKAEILCDDRMIVRRWSDGFKIHGTWSHGDVSDVSASSAPLKAVLFLEQAHENRLIQIDDTQEALRRLLACLIKPLVTFEWWDHILCTVDTMVRGVPLYSLHFDKSGGVVPLLGDL